MSPTGTAIHGEVTDAVSGPKQCGAKNKPGARHPRCRSTSLGPAGRCRMHNGWARSGVNAPNFKHGRHSQLLKDITSLSPHYERALADPDLLRLDGEIALTDARIGDLLERVSTSKKKGGAAASIDGVWPQLDALIENRRKLVDTESKRLKDLHAMVSVDRVMLIVSYLADSVKRHVKDPAVQTAILTDMRRLLKPEAALPG